MKNSSLILRSSDDTLENICARLPEIAVRHHFGVLATHDLKEKMRSKGVSFDRECRVFEVCNPHQAQAILLKDVSISAALPCRISIYAENGKTIMASIEPRALLALFDSSGSPDANAVADEVRATLVKIMDESAHDVPGGSKE